MRFGGIQSKYYGLALVGMVVILAVSNFLLLRQNLQLRNLLKKFEPDRLKAGDRLESFSALSLHGEHIAINFAGDAPRRVPTLSGRDARAEPAAVRYRTAEALREPARSANPAARDARRFRPSRTLPIQGASDSEGTTRAETFIRTSPCQPRPIF